MTSKPTIPVLDYTHFSDPRTRPTFVAELGNALSNVGFFALANHPVQLKLVKKTYQMMETLFQLPLDCKQAYEPDKMRGQRGYTSFGKEHAKDSNMPDLKEFWHVGQQLSPSRLQQLGYPENHWPTEIEGFRPTVWSLYEQMQRCALDLLEACDEYLKLQTASLKNLATEGDSILRLIHYPALEQVNCKGVRAAAHEDINLITLLVESTGSGLQIQRKDGSWLPISTLEEHIIVDSGDMLQNLSNGIFQATTHRVINPEVASRPRYSMPFFCHARPSCEVGPLLECIKTRGTSFFPKLTAKEFLHQRLTAIGLS